MLVGWFGHSQVQPSNEMIYKIGEEGWGVREKIVRGVRPPPGSTQSPPEEARMPFTKSKISLIAAKW